MWISLHTSPRTASRNNQHLSRPIYKSCSHHSSSSSPGAYHKFKSFYTSHVSLFQIFQLQHHKQYWARLQFRSISSPHMLHRPKHHNTAPFAICFCCDATRTSPHHQSSLSLESLPSKHHLRTAAQDYVVHLPASIFPKPSGTHSTNWDRLVALVVVGDSKTMASQGQTRHAAKIS